MMPLRDNVVGNGKGRRTSPNQIIKATYVSYKAQWTKDRVSHVDQVGVTLEGRRAAGERRALIKAPRKAQKTLIAQAHATFMDPSE